MSRIKYTATFPSKQVGTEVTWPSSVAVYPDATTNRPIGAGYLNESHALSVWTDTTSLTLTCDGESLTCTTGSPSQTGASPSSPGASSPVAAHKFVITPSTPDLLTGHVLLTPAEGDLVTIAMTVTDPWDGDSPNLWLVTHGDNPLTGNPLAGMDLASSAVGADGYLINNGPSDIKIAPGGLSLDLLLTASGATGDPGSTTGEAVVVLVVTTPS